MFVKKYFYPLIVCSIVISACVNDKIEIEPTEPTDTTKTDTSSTDTTDTSSFVPCSYSGVIESIITTNCAVTGCHVAGFGSGDFTSYAGVKDKVDNGDRIRVRVLDDKNMPPGTPLSQADRDSIDCWLNNGALNN